MKGVIFLATAALLVMLILAPLARQEQPPQLAIVVSTLMIAARFNPLRWRIQAFIVMRCVPILLRRGKGSAIRFKVQELLGHATVAITLDIYSHMIPGMGTHNARAMEDVFS
jgi:integrase